MNTKISSVKLLLFSFTILYGSYTKCFHLIIFLYLQIIIFLFITPGTPRIVIVSHSVNYGVRKCLWTALGDISANTVQMVLVVFVIGSLFSNNPQILNILKWLGVAYLFYLAYDTYKSEVSSINSGANRSKSIFSFFKDGFVVAGTSPKAWAFFPLIFPQFLDFSSKLLCSISNFNVYLCYFRFCISNGLCNSCRKKL